MPHGHAERDRPRRILGAGANVALLAAAVDEGHDRRRTREHERADPVRPTDLVRRHAQRGEAAGGEVDRQVAVGGDGVGVHGHPVSSGERHDLGDGLDRTDLVVGDEHRHERNVVVAVEGGLDGGNAHPAERVERQPLEHRSLEPLEPLDGVDGRMVLALGDQDAASGCPGAPRPVQPLEGEIDRLGAPAGEHHLNGIAAEGRGDVLAGLLEHPLRVLTLAVDGGGVSDDAQRRGVGRDRLRDHRRRRRMIEVHGHGDSGRGEGVAKGGSRTHYSRTHG